MPYFVAPGRAVTSSRGMINAGDPDSEVTWKDFCRDLKDKTTVTVAKDQIKRLLDVGAIVEAESMPMTKEQLEAAAARESISQDSIALQRLPAKQMAKKTGVKGRQKDVQDRLAAAKKRAPVEQSVDLSGDPGDDDGDDVAKQSVALSEEAEAAEKAAAEAAEKAAAEAKTGAPAGAQKAADPLNPGGGD